MKKIDHLYLGLHLFDLITLMFNFRSKYRLNEASMWDLIHLYIHYSKHTKGCTVHSLMTKRYGTPCGYKALRERLDKLILKGLIHQQGNILIPSNQVYLDLAALRDPKAPKTYTPGKAIQA